MQLLDKIKTPEDLKQLDVSMLKVLAHEIRQRLVEVTAQNGGHLAPNLGVVELTLALHYVYQTPKDKIIWDVGHQSYVHKMLTGRLDRIDSIRLLDGLSGFPKRSESEHDAFGAGHSSTSISAAVGFALSRDLRHENYDVVAIIGDGAMTGGMAFEALNNIGHLQRKMVVILNDNEMSIDPNVGGMSEYLSRVRSDPSYLKSKEDLEILLKKIPSIGDKMFKAADRLKDSFKYLLVPGTIFEELGLKYFGPINGHDLPALINVLENTKKIDKPVLIHIITKKGKGYAPAEQMPDKFHGVAPFDIKSGELLGKKKNMTYTDAFADGLIRLGKMDEKILGITAAMGQGTGIGKFEKQFPERAFDVGIAEQHAVTMAAAMALDGFKPVVAIYSTFLQRAYDQVLHDVALQNAPVVFALDRAGLVGDDGPTHHGVFDIAYLRHIPNLVLMAPKDEDELQQMLYSALQYQCPVAIRYPRGEGLGVALSDDFQLLEKGKGEVLRDGDTVVLLAYGAMTMPAQKAAEILKEQHGISTAVINARFAKPLDASLIIQYLTKCQLLVTLEEHILSAGFGSAVLEMVKDQGYSGDKVMRIGLPDEFITHGNTEILKERYGLTAKGIVKRVLEKLNYGK